MEKHIGEGPSLLTLQQAADILGVSLTTVFKLQKEGAIETVKLGRLTKVRREAILNFIASLKGRNARESVCA